ncbi:hypothetical protein GWI33_017220 [Rhynchophorus ferrugineus]|uniref:Uncharacterized protein n=1 Tax=Rhynchophorus ferrugineus TaxID=354439 RepID=A0A834HZI9_RHYFE|nr:hypothetical protein GWI33_017220 [Rhynchophorus ferrugineus]
MENLLGSDPRKITLSGSFDRSISMNFTKDRMLQVIWYLSIFSGIVCEASDPKEMYVKCPDYCDCDVFEKFNRATCQDQKLVDLELGVPKEAQILDISWNYIKELKDKAFVEQRLTELKLLNISHNKLSHIHFNAFEGMSQLKTLDLSYNAIEYFLENWFVSLSSLEELYLRGNNLKSINKQPLISIKTLRMLDLSSCRIIHLNNDLFSRVPNLWYLDISDNYLTNLRVDIITPLRNLTKFKVENNQFACRDRSFSQIRKYTAENNISYVDPCTIHTKAEFEINDKPMKFQKMMVTDEAFEKPTTENIEKNRWLKINPIDIAINSTSTNTTESTENNEPPKSLFRYILDTSPWLLISLAFFYGFCIGVILMCAINLIMRKPWLQNRTRNVSESRYSDLEYPNMTGGASTTFSRQSKANRFSRIIGIDKYVRQEVASGSDDDELMMNEFISNSTPMQPRKDYE